MSCLLQPEILGAVVVSGSSIGNLLIELVIAGLIFWLVTWALGQLPIPEPFKTVIRVVLIVMVVVFLLNVLFGLGGHAFISW